MQLFGVVCLQHDYTKSKPIYFLCVFNPKFTLILFLFSKDFPLADAFRMWMLLIIFFQKLADT